MSNPKSCLFEVTGWDAGLPKTLLLLLCLGSLVAVALLPLTSGQQWVFGGFLIAVALWLDVVSRSYLSTVTMIVLSCFVTLRYAVWRYSTLWNFLRYPSLQRTALDVFFMSILAAAELYTIVILYLGYFQTIYPLQRRPVEMPEDLDLWPHVDVLIPTYNEPLELVRYTVLAAMNMDWPANKLHIFLLDDGRRQQFREFAERAGIPYVTRTDNKGAKAGNINHALRNTKAPFVAIFDCDHVPVRSFLQVTMGWFFRDPRAALVQTPHHFYSPDPFERNLKQFRDVPNEGQLFYGIVQVCNDFWNASFFCGSCAVIRREALDEVGGIATETVTEDAHTSLRMQMAGWNTAYINTPQAAGLATERLSGHVKQRIRWARGMVQILRTENPLIVPGLKWGQRLCYFNAMMHFMYALPRLIFLTIPLVYLLFGYKVIPGSWDIILAFALPHIFLAQITNSRIQGEHRHSFWNEVYETVLAPYILLPTLLALIDPKIGKFDVTDKGGVIEESYLDTQIAWPFFVLLWLNIAGLCMVPVRMFYLDPQHPGTALINAVWDLLSMVVVGVAIGVAYESQQRRQSIRVAMRTVAWIVLPDGTSYEGSTVDLSVGGSAIHLDQYLPPSCGVDVQVVLPRPSGTTVSLPARIVGGGGRVVRIQFQELSILQERKLVGVLFSRANAWMNWGDNTMHDSLARSFTLIVKLSWRGIRQATGSLFDVFKTHRQRKPVKPADATALGSSLGTLIFLAGLAWFGLGLASPLGHAQSSTRNQGQQHPPSARSGKATDAPVAAVASQLPATQPGVGTVDEVPSTNSFDRKYSLADLGATGAIELRGDSSTRTLSFVLPETDVASQATLRIQYSASPSLVPSLSHINVLLNGTLFATLPIASANTTQLAVTPGTNPVAPTVAEGKTVPAIVPAIMEQVVTLPADLLVHRNTITFQLIGHYTVTACEDPANTSIWAQIDSKTTLDVGGNRMAMANDLDLLPLPFFDEDSAKRPKINVVFLVAPSRRQMEAAAAVASWIGVMADYRQASFSVSVGNIPAGNAIVFGAQGSTPGGLSLSQLGLQNVQGATLAVRTNPGDAFGKLLVVAGADDEQVLQAAQALTLNPGAMAGDTAQVAVRLPQPRVADDAPRWLNTKRPAQLGQMQLRALESDGTAPVDTYLHTAPDIYYGLLRNLRLHLYYRYDPVPLAPQAHMTVSINDAFAASIPLLGGDRVSQEGNVALAVPAEDMAPFANTLRMNFFMPVTKSGLCRSGGIAHARAAILPDSYLDVEGLPHWAALPNLQLFSNAGFPFTRFADLSQTSIVMPLQPSAADIELLLTLVAHMGAETGYPALRLKIASPHDLGSIADRDYLVLGSAHDQPAFEQLAPYLPAALGGSGLHIRNTNGIFAPIQHFWWRIQGRPVPESGQIEVTGKLPDAMLEAIESPYHPGRSIVVVMVRQDTAVAPFLTAFADAVNSSAIAQSVSILHGSSFDSYRLGNSLYHVGKLPLWDLLSIELAEYPYAGAILLLFLCFVLAILIRSWLMGHARRRLLDRSGRGKENRE